MTVAWSNANEAHGWRTKVDDETLQRLLWRRTDRFGVVRFRQDELAAELLLHPNSMHRIFRRMEAADRMQRVSTPRRRGTAWQIADPDSALGVRASYLARRGHPRPHRGRKPPRRLRTPPRRVRRSP